MIINIRGENYVPYTQFIDQVYDIMAEKGYDRGSMELDHYIWSYGMNEHIDVTFKLTYRIAEGDDFSKREKVQASTEIHVGATNDTIAAEFDSVINDLIYKVREIPKQRDALVTREVQEIADTLHRSGARLHDLGISVGSLDEALNDLRKAANDAMITYNPVNNG